MCLTALDHYEEDSKFLFCVDQFWNWQSGRSHVSGMSLNA